MCRFDQETVKLMGLSIRSYPNASRMLLRMPADIRNTFTPSQIQATETALVPRTHKVDIRFSLPLMSTGIYFIFLAGPDRRKKPLQTVRKNALRPSTAPSRTSARSPNAWRLLSRVSPEVRATFTPAQIQAVEAALIPRSHIIDFRLSLPFLGKNSYLALAAGPNRRVRYRQIQKGNPFIALTVFASIVIGAVSIFGLVHLKSSKLLAKPDRFTKKEGFHPTAVPFKTNRGECEESGRQWIENQCIDTIHDPVF